GSVRCITSLPSQGQGHATTLGQLLADRLGVPLERVHVQRVDTAQVPPGTGTTASRGAVALGGLAERAAAPIASKLRMLAAHALEASAEDIVLADGQARVRGVADRGVAIAE